MSLSLPLESKIWSPALARHLDAVCNRFEAAWVNGDRPQLEAYLADTPEAERAELLRELLALELAYRWRSRETPTVDEYVIRFPEHTEVIRAVFREASPAAGDSGTTLAHELGNAAQIEPAAASQETAVGPSGSSSGTSVEGLPADRVPQLLGQTLVPAHPRGPEIPGYEVLDVLGRGGMGIVYRARQLKLKRLVALKMILAGADAAPHLFQRFRVEAEAVARLQHPNVVQIYEIGEHAGQPYLALEYVEGGSLEQKLDGTPLPPGQAAQLLETVARAMHYAHEHGIVHRDLKPANILMQIADCRLQIEESKSPICNLQSAIPKITDFGLAKQLGDDSSQTHSGAILGTPSYMAPEQAGGDRQEIGPAADVHALGAILYETLTGRSPFRGASVLETLAQVRTQEPVPPSRLQPKVPRDLETICLMCLRKEPPRRYASAEVLADDLGRFLRGEPIQARPTPAWERALKWVKRRPAAAALLAVSTLAPLIVAASLVLLLEQRARYAEQGARVAERDLRELERLDEARAQIQGFLREGQAAALQEHWQEAVGAYDKALAAIASEPLLADLKKEVEHLRQTANGKMAYQQARAQATRKQKDFRDWRNESLFHGIVFTGVDLPANLKATRTAAEKALALFGVSAERETAPIFDASLSDREKAEITSGGYELLLILAEAAAQQGTPEQIRKAVEILDRAAKLGPPTKAFHLRRARYLALLRDDNGAQQERDRAQALKPASALDYFLLGDEQQRQGKPENLREAIGHFERAVRLEPDYFWGQFFLAVGYLKSGQPDRAKGPLTVCLLRQPPHFPWVYLLRGFAHGQLNELQAAEEDFEQAEQCRPNADARYNLALNRGALRMLQKRYPEAVAELNKAIELKPSQYQPYQRLAEIDQNQKHLEQAAGHLDRAVALAQAGRVEAPILHRLYRDRARLHDRKGDPNAALRDLEQALALEPPESESVELAEDQLERGRILRRLGNYPEAVMAYEAALKVRPTHAHAHLGRGEALLKLEHYREAVEALSQYVRQEKGKVEAHIYLDRGLARAWLGDRAGAIEDYTRAVDLQRDARTHAARGWAYLFQESPKLALHDFQEAIRLEAENADAYTGLGFAQAKLGQYRQGVAAVEKALSYGQENARLLCNAARVFAQAVGQMDAETSPRGRLGLADRRDYQDRALKLLRKAVVLHPPNERPKFWKQIAADTALRPIRSSQEFGRMAAEFSARK